MHLRCINWEAPGGGSSAQVAVPCRDGSSFGLDWAWDFFPLYLISFGVTLDEEKKEELNYYDYFFIQSKFWRGCFYFTLVGHQHT